MERTELVFVLDRSGSMSGLEKQTIEGYNKVLHQQKELAGDVYVTTVLFDNVIETLYVSKPIEEIQDLSEKDYYVRGCTALLDAIGYTMKAINQKQKETAIDHVIFVITTDGYENASQKYNYAKIAKKIKKHQEKHGWKFIFLGAGEGAIQEACNIGIKEEHTAKLINDKKGVGLSYEAAASFIKNCLIRQDTSHWNEQVNADYEKRR